MKKHIVLFIALAAPVLLQAQSIERQVIASAGGFAIGGNANLSATIGEMAIETVSAGGTTLMHGFQQSDMWPVSVAKLPVVANYQVYPNPATDVIHFSSTFTQEVSLQFAIYDITGRQVLSLANSGAKATTIEQRFNVAGLASGTYQFVVRGSENEMLKTIPFTKQ